MEHDAAYYIAQPGKFYEEQVRTGNPLRQYMHAQRYRTVNQLVQSVYSPGMSVYDFGAGSSTWNAGRLPVHAFDYNQAMLQCGHERGQNSQFTVGDILTNDIPDQCADIIVATEFIEHIKDVDVLLAECYRILRPGGSLVVSVPYDRGFSLWRILFPIHCFIQGRICGDPYYQGSCGHEQAFSPETLRSVFAKQHFIPVRLFSFLRFWIYCSARKPEEER